jgi:GTP-binding protein
LDIHSVRFERAAYKPEDFPRDKRPQFAMVGRSNVGKSSLINAVLKRKAIARVSQTAGKSQAVQFYLVNE